ncbi:MAG: biotin/lipoyl-binding protein [Planctomycetota bacterium]
MQRIVTWTIVIGVLAALVWAALRTEAIAVETASVVRGDLAVTLRDEGRTRVRERFVIAAPLDGLLHRVALEPGDEVTAGQVLARIEPLVPAFLDARALAGAEARVAAAEALVQAAREREAQAIAQRDAAEEDLQRRIRGGEAVSAQSVADARREVLYRAGEVAGARASLTVAEAERQVARAALVVVRPDQERATGGADDTLERSQRGTEGAQSAQSFQDAADDVSTSAAAAAPARLAPIALCAPTAGRVLAVPRESAGPVRAGEALIELADVRDLELVADFLTSDAVRMVAGMEAAAVDWGGGAALAARVRRVEPAARTKVSALGVEEQRVDVILDLIDPRAFELALGDGFRVEVEVVLERAADVLLVPEAALIRSGADWSVFTVSGDRVTLAVVELGRRDGRRAEVLAGLVAGAEVVLFPSDGLAPGARVTRRKD